MKRKLKIYLDTSVISAYFEKRNPDKQYIPKNFLRWLTISCYLYQILI